MKPKPRILVVDDDKLITRTLADIFDVKGFSVEAANSGREALEIIKRSKVEIMLSDIRMPEMNGVELFRAARSIRKKLAVILMTAYATDQLVQEGLKEGALIVLGKPLDIDNLLLHITDFLKN